MERQVELSRLACRRIGCDDLVDLCSLARRPFTYRDGNRYISCQAG